FRACSSGFCFFFQAEDGIRDFHVTGVQTCALPILGLKADPTNPNGYLRHPLVYLVEAADDICYNIIDLEDAHHLKILSYIEVEELLLPLCGGEDLRKRLDALADTGSRVELLRAKAINTLIHGCATVFAKNQDKFL